MSKDTEAPDLADREGALNPDVDGEQAAIAGLSAEEQAALGLDDEQADEGDAGDDQAGGDDAEAGGKADDDPAPLQAESDDPAEPADGDDTPGPSDEEPDRGEAPNATILPVEADIAEIQTKRAEVDQKIADLDKQYDEGDLDFAEYRTAERALQDERTTLIGDQREAELAHKVNVEAANRTWEDSTAEFLSENQEFMKVTMRGALNVALQELYADNANATASHDWLLQTAATRVREEMGIPAGDPDKNIVDPAVQKAEERAKKAADARDNLPKTLGDAPESSEADTSADEFSSLDGLDGMELEAAVARLTPEQQDRFARG